MRISETNRRAQYYRLTRKGRRQLETEEEKWAALTGAVARVLKFV
jgi:DNA-binding PadR family transcriptional regulator